MSPAESRESHGRGAIVLAAYRPDPELFATQLRTIRDQTYRDFVCLVGADGGADDVRAMVEQTVGPDDRFSVVGWDDNVGFYLNFERLLDQVPEDCDWVALSDHDDAWHLDKLTKLIPRLADSVLVTGQARIVEHPGGRVLKARTHRKVVGPCDLLIENQVSGALCVFRTELLGVALPFPRLHTVTQLHDHWLAMCAVAVDRYEIIDDVVQDYVQHSNNAVGESPATVNISKPKAALSLVPDLAWQYEGGRSVAHCVRALRSLSFGWRWLMIDTLGGRVRPLPGKFQRSWLTTPRLHPRAAALDLTRHALCSPRVKLRVALTFLAGLPGELAPTPRWRTPPEPQPALSTADGSTHEA